jgi:sugar phosphate isomerase/epimerase
VTDATAQSTVGTAEALSVQPRFAVSASSTWHASFAEDLASYAAAGVDGIGLWELKLDDGDDAALASALAESGLQPTICWPRVPGALPVDALFPGPHDARERTALLCASIRRLARFEPVAVACLGEGDLGDLTTTEARAVVVASLREAALVAGEAGVKLALEVIRPGPGANLTTTIEAALGIIRDVNVPDFGVFIDTWHVWDSPVAPAEIAKYGQQLLAVQVNDFAVGSRGWFDRALPGDGVMALPSILAALDASGFRGPYELEVFSDDGPLGSRDAASPWVADAETLMRSAHEGFLKAWRERAAAPVWKVAA